MPIKYKYTPEMLAAAAAISLSIADILRHLGITIAGGNHAHISRQLKRFEIDTSHFRRVSPNKGKPSPQRRRPEQVLTVRPKGSPRPDPSQLRRTLMAIGMPYQCAACKIEGVWLGRGLTLHVDHISGDWLDNRKENLRFLCPNCHSQTENFAGKNRGRSPTVEAHDLGSCQSGFESRRPHKRLKSHAIDLKPINTSVTISSQDVFFVEYYLDQKRAKTRPALIRKAIQLLRESTIEEDYAAAFSEMGEREEAKPPDSTVKDGIGDPV
jgi:hypothetical protein